MRKRVAMALSIATIPVGVTAAALEGAQLGKSVRDYQEGVRSTQVQPGPSGGAQSAPPAPRQAPGRAPTQAAPTYSPESIQAGAVVACEKGIPPNSYAGPGTVQADVFENPDQSSPAKHAVRCTLPGGDQFVLYVNNAGAFENAE